MTNRVRHINPVSKECKDYQGAVLYISWQFYGATTWTKMYSWKRNIKKPHLDQEETPVMVAWYSVKRFGARMEWKLTTHTVAGTHWCKAKGLPLHHFLPLEGDWSITQTFLINDDLSCYFSSKKRWYDTDHADPICKGRSQLYEVRCWIKMTGQIFKIFGNLIFHNYIWIQRDKCIFWKKKYKQTWFWSGGFWEKPLNFTDFLRAPTCQIWKSRFLTRPCHKNYRVEVYDVSIYNYSDTIAIF